MQIALELDHLSGPLSDTEGEIAYALSKLSQAIMNDTNFVRNSIPALEMGVDAIQQDQDRRRHDKILEWISPTDFPAQKSDFIAWRQEETGLWFLNSPKFTKWFRGKKQTLSCPGIPGASKTMMAAITIDHLLRTEQSNTIGVVYILCNYKVHANQNTISLLAAIHRGAHSTSV